VPRGRPPKAIDPTASSSARLGAEIRVRRVAHNLTLERLSRRVGCTPQHISEVELANTTVSRAFVEAVDRALEADGRIVDLYPAAAAEQETARRERAHARREGLRSRQEVDAKRRAFIGLGLSAVLLGPEAAARATSDEWDRIAYAWSYEVATAPDRSALLPGLVADLRRLQARGGPQHVVAQLSSHAAAIAVSVGDPGTARRWWRRARSSASVCGDRHLLAFVTGREAVQGLFGPYSLEQVVKLAERALRATGTPCTGRAKALAAKAQALAMLGWEREAGEVLTSLERTFNRLPRDVTHDKLSSLGWPEETLHHVRSYCAMYGVNPDTGAQARELALRLTAEADWRSRAQLKLYGADARDAVATLSDLSEAQRRDSFVRLTAQRALASCQSAGADVSDLRDVLG
jgi:transcriptional regulator with XRE-family HTH domain